MPRSSSRKTKKKKKGPKRNTQRSNRNLSLSLTANDLLLALKELPYLSATTGLAIHLALGLVKSGVCAEDLFKDSDVDFDDNTEEELNPQATIACACQIATLKIQLSKTDDSELDYPLEVIAPIVMQILANAHLIKGLDAPLVPEIENGEIVLNVTTAPEGLEITDEGEEFLSKIDTDGDLIASDEDFKMYSKLAVEYMQKAIDQSKVQ